MGLMDIVRAVAESAAKDANRSCDRIEKKYGGRMSQGQMDKVRSRKSGLEVLAEMCKKHR